MPIELTMVRTDVAKALRKQADRVSFLIGAWTMDGSSPDTCKAIREAIEVENRLKELANEFDPK